MQTAAEQLSTYKSVHFNRKNVATHFVGVPSIMWSLCLLLSLVSWPINLGSETNISINLAQIIFAGVVVYYFMLHWKLAIAMLLFIIPMVYTTNIVAQNPNALWIALAVFFIGWVIQFIGHYFEKAKPAFVDDLNQLLIGPFFLMAEIYFMIGFEKKLHDQIVDIAIEKRRALEKKRELNKTS